MLRDFDLKANTLDFNDDVLGILRDFMAVEDLYEIAV